MSLAIEHPFAPKHVKGLHFEPGVDAAHDIDIDPGECRDDTNVYNMVVTSAVGPVQIDASAGANAIDTGTVAADTVYHVWLIERSDTGAQAGLFSLSSTAPTMPASYDFKRRLGAVVTDGSANIYPFLQQKDAGRGRWIWYTGPAGDSLLIGSGTATSFTSTDTVGDHGDTRAPLTAVMHRIEIRMARTGSSETWKCQVKPASAVDWGAASTALFGGWASGTDGQTRGALVIPADADQDVEYMISGASGSVDIWLRAYMDSI